ncbi:hypothetical protein QMN58_27390, partial [Escherichia coli]|nr:hypothetical protein [Escherichia coli]
MDKGWGEARNAWPWPPCGKSCIERWIDPWSELLSWPSTRNVGRFHGRPERCIGCAVGRRLATATGRVM